MKTSLTKKVIALALAGCFTLAAFSGCGTTKKPEDQAKEATPTPAATEQVEQDPVANFSELKVSVMGQTQTGSKTPTKDVLTPIWREKTKVIPEIVSVPPGQDVLTWLQMQVVSGNVPEVIAVSNSVFDNPQVYEYLKKENVLKEIKLEDMKKYFKRIGARLESLGVSLEDWYKANVDPADGKLWYVPNAPNPNVSKEVRALPWRAKDIGPQPYSMYMRDDILKKIFPEAKTEAELTELFKQKGKLEWSDVNDIPIRNADELYDYLKKVKALGMKVGNKEVIPCHPMMNADVGSMMWSMYSFPGFWWRDLVDRFYTGSGEMVYFAATPEWKEYVRWMNKAYNEGLLGKEIFIQKDDQREAKIVNGEYAVFQRWNNVVGAREKSRQENRGYGYRVLYTFPNPLQTKYQDASIEVFSLKNNWGAIGITKSLSDEKFAQIMNWIDWNGSEEAAELRAWGTPDMYTGDKENRRYKPEFKELEAYAVSGTPGEKDGPYYGLYMRESAGGASWNHETYGICSSREWRYLYRPQDVYTPDASNINIDDMSDQAIKAFYRANLKFFVEKTFTPELMAADAEFKKLDQEYQAMKKTASLDADGAKIATVKAIVGKPEDFEKNYKEYEKYLTPEFMKSLKDQAPVYGKYKSLRDSLLEKLD